MRKRVLCVCYGPIAVGKQYRSPWEDVWLRWKGKPGRKVYRASLTLECAAEVVVDLQMHASIRSESPEMRKDWYQEEDTEYRRVLQILEAQPYAAIEWPSASVIVTNAKGLDRDEAERMMAWYLSGTYGIVNPKFIWKRPKICVVPTGFGNYSDKSTE